MSLSRFHCPVPSMLTGGIVIDNQVECGGVGGWRYQMGGIALSAIIIPLPSLSCRWASAARAMGRFKSTLKVGFSRSRCRASTGRSYFPSAAACPHGLPVAECSRVRYRVSMYSRVMTVVVSCPARCVVRRARCKRRNNSEFQFGDDAKRFYLLLWTFARFRS